MTLAQLSKAKELSEEIDYLNNNKDSCLHFLEVDYKQKEYKPVQLNVQIARPFIEEYIQALKDKVIELERQLIAL